MTNKELKIILENHLHWINEDIYGWRNMRANLTGAINIPLLLKAIKE